MPKLKARINKLVQEAKEELFDPRGIVRKLENLKDNDRLY